MNNNKMLIKTENLSVKKEGQFLLKDINLEIKQGQVLCIIGPNGGGKSTLIKTILGQIGYTGKIKFNFDKNKSIGYVPQALEFDKMSPISVLDLFNASLSKRPAFLKNNKYRQKIDRVLKITDAQRLIDRRLGALSGGELQRVLLALSLEPMPKLLMLDEPVSGVDSAGLERFYELVEHIRTEHELAVIIVSHDFEFVRKYSTDVALINQELKCIGDYKTVFSSDIFLKEFGFEHLIDR